MKRAIMRSLPAPVERRVLAMQAAVRIRRAERAIASAPLGRGRPHGLPGELVVSLTSYPPRFGTLAKTLKSILAQKVKADRTVLWVAEADEQLLPADVLELTVAGLEIRTCRDIRSYKKFIPALESWPDAYIVTADDDLYYEPGWLEMLVDAAVPGEKVIVCRRAHRPRRTANGFAPYAEWSCEVVGRGKLEHDLFPTTGAGALYPPGSLAPQVLDEARFMALAPAADDIWLYCMSRVAGSRYRQVGGRFIMVMWAGSQDVSLYSSNIAANDGQLRAVFAEYGDVAG
jgi:hypothetical protein